MNRILYDFAKQLPIIDYHNHLSVADIRENKRFSDITDLWISPDPYKHRAMRMCGVEEQYITGAASDKEKFIKWCETIPKLIGNPLYKWSLMELEILFGTTDFSEPEKLYGLCNEYLANNEVTPESLLTKFNVEFACPCASVTDDLTDFANNAKIAPSLRGDDMVSPTKDFVQKLERVTDTEIKSLDAFKQTICQRLNAFKEAGCKFSDHALDNGFAFCEDDGENEKRFRSVLAGNCSDTDREKLISYLLVFLGTEYAKRDLVMQLHIGAERFTSTKLRETAGPAGGFAGIGNCVNVKALTKLLDTIDCSEFGLPKTVLFTLNPADNAVISTLSGSYSKDGVSGLVTQGPAWWWCDHQKGITDMLENTTVFSVLSNFIGMTTDSRSFLSFVRHDYFRKILCNWIVEKVKKEEFPNDLETLKNLVYKLCYENAKNSIGGK